MMSVNYSTFQPAGKFGDHPFRVPSWVRRPAGLAPRGSWTTSASDGSSHLIPRGADAWGSSVRYAIAGGREKHFGITKICPVHVS